MSFRNAKGGYIRPGYDPLEVANPPTGASATAGSASASVSFTAPSNTGGGAITNYYAVSNPGQITASSVTSPISVSGLTNGTEYTFKVWGENSYGPSAYSAPTGAVTPTPPYIEDVFSTYLYTGNNSTQTITNGIDLAGEGGLVWTKVRSTTDDHELIDTVRGRAFSVESNTTDAQSTSSVGTSLTQFNSNGYSLGTNGSANVNENAQTFVSWTFRQAEKFFDVVTYTGDGVQNRAVAHNLGSVPGCIIVKRTDTTGDWYVWHRSINPAWTGGTTAGNITGGNDTGWIKLNTDGGFNNSTGGFTYQTSTAFGVYKSNIELNTNGATYVAYLFAHDAGGFGANGTDNVISCGSFTTDGSGGATVNLGYEPQWVMWKRTDGTGDWTLLDNMRGWGQTIAQRLVANTSAAEDSMSGGVGFTPFPTATGFFNGNQGVANNNYIYIAIRRGPMKTPTTGTSVFAAQAYTGTYPSVQTFTTNFPVDLLFNKIRGQSYSWGVTARLTGTGTILSTNSTAAEYVGGSEYPNFANNTGVRQTTADLWFNSNGESYVAQAFRRAPGFFDVVCYTGNGGTGSRSITHNLGTTPEFIIIKRRDATNNWATGSMFTSTTVTRALLNANNDQDLNSAYTGQSIWGGQPTSTTFLVDASGSYNTNTATYVAYLFATCSGVSKVGSYTGTGTTLQVNCGFTGGARFVLIKRVDSTGDWYVWDSARGIVAGNDPYLLLNSTAAEVTNTDYVDTYSAGFEISSTAPAAINANGGTYIFLAIA